ncbi:MAG: hypothetical protein AAGF12_42945, partial [Myxococcota bacterium]
MRMVVVLGLVLANAGCGESSTSTGGEDAAVPDAAPDGSVGVDATPDADVPDQSVPDAPVGDWVNLIAGDWTLPSGEEDYLCVRATVTEEMYIGAFRPVIPEGTHHTVLTMEDGNRPDGITSCSAGENGPRMIFGSGVGTPELNMPEGVAVRLPAGQQLLLNLHLLNA